MTDLYQGPLEGRFIFLSASTPSRDLDRFPRLQIEVEDAVIHLARAVFTKGGRLVFGGHPSISPLVASVASEYLRPDVLLAREQRPVRIFQSEAYRKIIPAATQSLEDFGYAAIYWTLAQNGEQADPDKRVLQCPASLRFMRGEMLKTDPLAMVAIGGMDGVAEEAGLFLQKTAAPIFALRSTGGVSSNLPKETAGWCQRQELQQVQSSVDQIEQRILMLEDEYPAPPRQSFLKSSQTPDPGSQVRIPYAFYLQKMVRTLIERRRP